MPCRCPSGGGQHHSRQGIYADADALSDIDILVDLEPGRSLLDLGGLLMDLQELFDCRVDVVTEKGLRPKIRERILRESVPL
jgi:predicted nucleotidyltransferase